MTSPAHRSSPARCRRRSRWSLAACGRPSPSPSAGPHRPVPRPSRPHRPRRPRASRDAGRRRSIASTGWRADLARARPGHGPRSTRTSPTARRRAELEAAVDDALGDGRRRATDDELMVGVLRIVAMVSAGGLRRATPARSSGAPARTRSTACRCGSGCSATSVVVVDALPPYEDLVGARIDSIEGHPIADVLAALDPIVPRDNAQTVRLLMPRFLLIPQVLRGLGLADDGPITLGLTPATGRRRRVDVEPDPDGRVQRLGRPVRPAPAGRPGRPLPLAHRRRPVVGAARRRRDAVRPVQPRRRAPGDAGRPTSQARCDGARRSRGSSSTSATTSAASCRRSTRSSPIFDDPAIDEPDRLFVAHRAQHVLRRQPARRPPRSADATRRSSASRWAAARRSGATRPSSPLPWSGIAVGVAGDVAVGVDPNDPRLTHRARSRARAHASTTGRDGHRSRRSSCLDVDAAP